MKLPFILKNINHLTFANLGNEIHLQAQRFFAAMSKPLSHTQATAILTLGFIKCKFSHSTQLGLAFQYIICIM